MNNLDVRSVLPLLQQMGVDPSKLGPDKLERLMKLSDKIKNPDQITPELISEITNYPLIDGLIFEIFNSNLLIEVSTKENMSESDLEHVTKYIRDNKIEFKKSKVI